MRIRQLYGQIGMMTFLGAAALFVAVLAMRVTTPLGIGPLGVTAWFLLVLIGLSGLAAAAVYWGGLLVARYRGLKLANPKKWAGSSSRRGLLIGGYLTVLLALSTLGQLNLRDALLLLILLLLVEFYTVAHA